MRHCKFYIFFIFFHCALFLKAQETIQLNTELQKDTLYISQLLDNAKTLRHHATDSAIRLYKYTYHQSRNIKYINGIARSLTALGLMYMDKGEYDTSLMIYKFALPYSKFASSADGRAIVVLYNNIAALYGNRGVSDTAAIYYYKALKEFEDRKLKDSNLLILMHSNLGSRLVSIRQTKQAKYYLKKGEEIALITGNDPMLAKIYVGIAALYRIGKKYDSARLYATKALQLFEKIKDPGSEIAANSIIGKTYLKEKKPRIALRYFQRAFSKKINASKTQLAVAYRGLGESYYQLKDYKRSEQNYLEALRISKAARLNKSIMECYDALVNIYTALENYKLALQYRNAYVALSDSALTAAKINAFSQLDIKYRTSQNEKEIAQKQLLLTQQRNELDQKNIWMGTIAGCSIIFLILLGSNYRTRKQKQTLRIINLHKEKQMAQLKAMMTGEEKERIRIARELHDGIMIQFSSVQMNLSAMIERSSSVNAHEFDTILQQLEEATKDLRKSAHNLMPDMLLKEGLAEATHYFCKTLQKSAKIDIDVQLYGTTPPMAPEYELMIYRIIQELLQNIIKHAKATSALLQINCYHDMLSIAVEDNGVGLDIQKFSKEKARLPDGQGMGIQHIKDRIHSLHGNVSFNSKKDCGTSVYIELFTQYLQQANANIYADNHLYS